MAERVEERLEDLERLVIKQAERIEELEQQMLAMTRMAHQSAQRVRPPKSEAA